MARTGTFSPKLRLRLILTVAAGLAVPGTGQGQTALYLDHDGLTRELRSLVNGSDLARMRSVGTSLEGREVWLVEIGDPAGAPMEERPGVLVVGNLEGDHLVGSSLALETIRYFLSEPQSGPEVRETLAQRVVYVFPRVNPDGAEAMFRSVRWDRKTNARPVDDDNDGRIDEDGPEDLNGDGVITVMRVVDRSGDYMIDPADPRLLKKADPGKGEAGEYTLYWEGTDSDGDGFLNEDGPGGVDLNRNFQHEYPYWDADAGPHMVSEPESRALMDFVIAHRNIGAILAFGLTDNLVTPPSPRGTVSAAGVLELPRFADASNAGIFEEGVFDTRPAFDFGEGFGFGPSGRGGGTRLRGAQPGRDNDPGSGRRPATTVNPSDQEYFKAASDAYRSITGIEQVGMHRQPQGAFFQYGYFQFGVPSFSTTGWGLPAATGETGAAGQPTTALERPVVQVAGRAGGGEPAAGGEDGLDARLLAALEGAGIEAFVEWTPYDHPSLGQVEIGGFRPYATTNPPAEDLLELGRKHGEFVARLASMLPRVSIVETSVTAHGGGIFTVEAEVENSGYFPTSLQHGIVSASVQPTMVQIQIPPEDLLTGDPKTSTVEKLDGSGSRERFAWVIRGRPGAQVEIKARAEKGGTDTATVTLR